MESGHARVGQDGAAAKIALRDVELSSRHILLGVSDIVVCWRCPLVDLKVVLSCLILHVLG